MGKRKLFRLMSLAAAIIIMSSAQAQKDKTYNVSGKYIYHTDGQSPLGDVLVTLVNQTNQVVATTFTNNDGIYSFSNIPAGDYSIKASSNKPSRGYDMKDCYSLLKYLNGFETLDNIQRMAADVDNNNIVDKNDLKLMIAAWARPSVTFPAGNWKFETANITVKGTKSGSDEGSGGPDIPIPPSSGTSTGDLGSVFLPGNKPATAIDLAFTNTNNLINSTIELPVRMTSSVPATGFGLSIDCPINFKIEEVIPSIEGLTISISAQTITVNWLDPNMKTLDLSNTTTLFVIKGKSTDGNPSAFALGEGSHLISKSGDIVYTAKIDLPKLSLQKSEASFAFALKGAWPNPFTGSTKIVYTLPTSGVVEMKIFNITGQLVATPVKGFQEAGFKELPFIGNSLQSGVYFCTISLKGDKNYSATSRMILTR
jgi:hypothetical protein